MKKKQRLSAFLTLINLFLPHWNFFLVKCLLQGLSEDSALWGGRGCPASSPGQVWAAAAVTVPMMGTKATLILGHSACPETALPGESGMERTQAASWGGTWEAVEGQGQEWQGTFLVWSASGLSRLYQRVINWQSAGLRFGNQSIQAQKQPGEKMYLGSTQGDLWKEEKQV